MDNPWVVAAVTVGLIASSAFFVAVEFALIAARRHRLEDAAATSGSARAALRSASELSVLLAGSQLGITVCTLALGSVTKPAVHYWLTPVFAGWGLPYWSADVIGFVLAYVVIRADLALTGSRGSRARRNEERSAEKPECISPETERQRARAGPRFCASSDVAKAFWVQPA